MLLAFLTSGIVAFGQSDEKAKEILDKMSDKYQRIPSYRVNFVYAMSNKVENIQEEYSGEIWVKGKKFKLIVGDQEVINDGEIVWTYFKDVNEVNIDYYVPEDGDMTPVTMYNEYKTGYKYLFVEDKKSGARNLSVVELQPEQGTEQFEELIKIKLEIDKANNTLSAMQIFDRSGSIYTYSMSGFNTQSAISESMFNFDTSKYPGIEVVDLR